MSRILVIAADRGGVREALNKRDIPHTHPNGMDTDEGRIHVVTPADWNAVRGYTWDRIEIMDGAKEHPNFDDFFAYVTLALIRHTADDNKPPLRWNTIDTARHNAAIEVAEAYRAIRPLGVDLTARELAPHLDRLEAAAAWEKIR